MAKKFFLEDYRVGDQFETHPHQFETQEIIEFAKAWDPQPFHLDEAIAKASHFGGLTACSAHIFSVFCRISQQWTNDAEQQAIASLGFDEMRMLAPVFTGDTVHCTITVEQARASKSNSDRGVVSLRCTMINQDNAEVYSILASFLVKRRLKT